MTICSVDSTGICLTPEGLYSVPEDCNKYYKCSNGVAHLTSCAEGTLWNDQIKICDWPYNVNCDSTSKS